MVTGLTPGRYATRTGQYEVQPDGTIWLVGGQALPEGAERMQVDALPPDAAMTNAALGGPASGGMSPQGKRGEAPEGGEESD